MVLRCRARGLMQIEESGCTRPSPFPTDYSCPDWGLVLAEPNLMQKEPEGALAYMSQPLILGKIEGRGRGGDRGRDVWKASLTQWT